MKSIISILISYIIVTFGNLIYAQNDSPIIVSKDSIPIFEEFYNDGPPCGIPCSPIFDKFGNFVDCQSPCCNCREIYGEYNLLESILKIEFDNVDTLQNLVPEIFEFGTKENAIEYFTKQEESGNIEILKINKRRIKYKILNNEDKLSKKHIFKMESIDG
ncbi:MAG: hypothetical protein ACFHWX_05875 [Bacteroidota bacterium]